MPRPVDWSRYCSYCYLPTAFVSFLLIQGVYTQTSSGNGTTAGSTCPGVNVALRALPSDPTYQSTASSVLIASPMDPTVEYLCSCGSGYDTTGITCYSLKCPASYNQLGQYGGPYGNRTPNSPYMQPGPYGAQGAQSISVGPQVGSAETTYPCWKLKQLRLNTYVYLVCFVKGYSTVIYQLNFKENYQMELTQVEAVANPAISSVARVTYTTDNGLSCLVAVFSSYIGSFHADPIREPSDLVAPVYYICPNKYRWYFCGNLPLVSTVDVSLMPFQKDIKLIAAQTARLDAFPPSAGGHLMGVLPPYSSVIAQYPLSVDIENSVCGTRGLPDVIVNIGCPMIGGNSELMPELYPLCGVTKAIIASVAGGNVTLLCASVDTLLCQMVPNNTADAPKYSSFCLQYDVNAQRPLPEKVVFLQGANEASEIQYLRGGSDSCQFLVVASPTKNFHVYCLSAIAAAINNMTSSCDMSPPVAIAPLNTGSESLFHSAVGCSLKSKCCNGQSTCITCNRPAKYGEKYLAELVCSNGGGNGNGGYKKSQDNGGNGYNDPDGNSYNMNGGGGMRGGPGNFGMMGPGGYGRPLNYSANNILPAYGPQLPQAGPYGQPGPYMLPPGAYQGPQPPIGARYV